MALPVYEDQDLRGDQQAFLDSLTADERRWGNEHSWVPVSGEIMVYVNHYDISGLFSSATWSGSKSDVARKLELSIVSDDNYYMPEFEVKMHDMVQFFVDGVEIFRGYVMDVDRSLTDKNITYTCYDAGIFLSKSKGKYKFTNVSPAQVVQTVCADFDIPVAEVEDGVNYTRIHDNDSIYDIIMTGYTLTSQSNGKQYYLRFDLGALSVLEKGKIVYEYMLTADRDITEASFQSSSLNAVNRVKAYNSDGTEAGVFSLDSEYDFPGVLQAVYKAENGGGVGSGAEALLQDVELSASIEGFGVLECTSGKAVVVSEPTTGLDGLFYIDSDTHTFENGFHTMSLDIAFENVMDQVLAGSVEQVQTSGSLGASGYTVQERVWNFLRAQGFSAAATAAIMGNIQQESGFDPTIEEIGNAIGYGLCQWSYERRTNLETWCNNNGYDYTTVEGQLAYLIYELEGGDPTCVSLMNQMCGGLEGFKQLTDVALATQIFQQCFERAGIPNMTNRVNAANEFYNKWKDYEQIPLPETSNVGSGGAASSAVMGVYEGSYGLAYPLPEATGIAAYTYAGHTNSARDFQPPTALWGTPVVSILDGVVVAAGNGVEHWTYGNSVYIDHGNGWMSRYAHLDSISVSPGQTVKKGQVLGGCGSTGNSSGLHLHLEVHAPWGWTDPGPLFSQYSYMTS